jgi:hypothetical protein
VPFVPRYLRDPKTGEPVQLPVELNRALCCPECGVPLVRTSALYHGCGEQLHGRLYPPETLQERLRPLLAKLAVRWPRRARENELLQLRRLLAVARPCKPSGRGQ